MLHIKVKFVLKISALITIINMDIKKGMWVSPRNLEWGNIKLRFKTISFAC